MANYSLGKAYSDLPRWSKGIVAIGVIGGVILLAWSIRSIIKGKLGSRDLNTWKGEEKDLAKRYTPTYTDAQNASFANQIYEGVKYASVSDNYPLVVSVMKKMKNDLDVARLVAAYGKRQRYNFAIPVGEPIDLFTTMQVEIGDGNVKEINKDWSLKSITYQI